MLSESAAPDIEMDTYSTIKFLRGTAHMLDLLSHKYILSCAAVLNAYFPRELYLSISFLVANVYSDFYTTFWYFFLRKNFDCAEKCRRDGSVECRP